MAVSEQDARVRACAERYAKEYMEKVFYFCLKKTGSRTEAEDLSSEIFVCILQELRKGVQPMQFSAWVWQIARNRYSRWADAKRQHAESVSGADLDELTTADDADVEADCIRNEEMTLLRRELAFISSEYRSILVAHYIEDKPLRLIARTLHLSESAVKMRLSRARKQLKEGMEMARTFGKMSYAPEEVSFSMNGGPGDYGEPWTVVNQKLNKNLLLAAYRTPSTAQELSIELGVALPYTEDALERLVRETLMRKNGDRYETDFMIISAKAQERYYAKQKEITPQLTELLTQLLAIDESGKDEEFQPYEDAKWALLMRWVDRVFWAAKEKVYPKDGEPIPKHPGKFGQTVRPNNGEWDLSGYENYHGEKPAFVGLHGGEVSNFGQYKFCYRDIQYQTPVHLSPEEQYALVDAATGNASAADPKMLEKLVGYGYLKKDGGTYKPNILVMKQGTQNKRTPEQEEACRALFDKAVQIALELYRFCMEVVGADVSDFLREDRFAVAHACDCIFCSLRGAVLEEALRTGFLHYEDDGPKRMLGAYLFI